MKKILLIIVGVLAALIAIALIAPFFIPEATIKETVVQQIQKATGREVTIGGNLRLTFFPSVGAYAEKVTLSNPQNYPVGAPPLLTFNSMNVSVALVPLLNKKIEVTNLTLTDPQVSLHVTAGGVSNWTFGKPAAPAPAAAPAAPASQGIALPIPANLLLSHVKVSNGTVDYVNEATHEHWTIGHLAGSVELNGLTSPFTVSAEGEWNKQVVHVSGTVRTLMTMIAKMPTLMEGSVDAGLAQVAVSGTLTKDNYVGTLKLNSSSLKNLLAWATPGSKPLETPGPLATNMVADVDCMPSQLYCVLKKANLAIDSLKAAGTVKLYMDHGVPQVEADLTAGQVDLNAFLPPEKKAELIGNPIISDALAAEAWSHTPLDLAALQSVGARITINNEGILWRNVHVGKNSFRLKLAERRLGVDLVNAVLYDGTADISASIDNSGPAPVIETHDYLKGVELGSLLKDMSGSERVSGKTDLQINVNGYGKSVADIIASLAGNGKASIPSGVVHGVNLTDMLHNVSSAFGAAGKDPNAETKFTNAGATFTIAKGIVSNSDLAVTMPGMQVAGQGQVNLPAYNVHYRLTPQLTGSTGAGLAVPVIIDGSLDNPSYQPDVGSVIKNALQDPKAFKEQLKNSKGSLKDQLKNPKDTVKGLKDMLKGF